MAILSPAAIKEMSRINALTDRVAKRREEYEKADVWVSSQVLGHILKAGKRRRPNLSTCGAPGLSPVFWMIRLV